MDPYPVSRIRICIHFNQSCETVLFPGKFKFTVQNIENYDTNEAAEKDKTM